MIDLIIYGILTLFESESRVHDVCEKPVSSQPDFVQNDDNHFRIIHDPPTCVTLEVRHLRIDTG